MIEISVKLVAPSGRIAAARVVTARAPAAGTSGPAATQALDTALGDVMRQIVAVATGRF